MPSQVESHLPLDFARANAELKASCRSMQAPELRVGGGVAECSGGRCTLRMDPVYRSISLQTYLAENEHSVALSHQRAPATARGHQEMDGQAAGQAPLRVDSTAAAFGGARRTRPPSRDAGRAHRGRATWALVPALRLAPCHWAVLSVCWVPGYCTNGTQTVKRGDCEDTFHREVDTMDICCGPSEPHHFLLYDEFHKE